MSEKVAPDPTLAESPTQSESGVGAQLRAAREARQLSVAEVAKALKLGATQIVSIEAEDWANLPCAAVVRGLVRNYARLVELDANALMLGLNTLQLPQVLEVHSSNTTYVKLPREGKFGRFNASDYLYVICAWLVLLIALLAYFFLPMDWWAFASSTFAPARSPVAEEKLVSREITKPQTIILDRQPDAQVVDNHALAPALSLVSSAPENTTSLSQEAEQANPTEKTLTFSFARSAWVEVRDQRGKIIFSQLNAADSKKSIVGQPPFSLIIGNARYVSLQYQAKPVVLPSRGKDGIARFTLE